MKIFKKSCAYCSERSWSPEYFTVIQGSQRSVKILFNYCPICGQRMKMTTKDKRLYKESNSPIIQNKKYWR